MPNKIERKASVTQTYTFTASASTSPKVPFAAAAGGVFIVDAVSGAASINWYTCFGAEGTPAQLNDGSSDVSTSITAGKAYPLPDALFGSEFVVGVVNSGTATVRICVKT